MDEDQNLDTQEIVAIVIISVVAGGTIIALAVVMIKEVFNWSAEKRKEEEYQAQVPQESVLQA